MKARVIALLLWMLEWLDPQVAETIGRVKRSRVPEAPAPNTWVMPSQDIIDKAREVIPQVASLPNTGAHKAAVALKLLQKHFPDRRRRNLKLAIELVVQELQH
jgi:hypothetical protein